MYLWVNCDNEASEVLHILIIRTQQRCTYLGRWHNHEEYMSRGLFYHMETVWYFYGARQVALFTHLKSSQRVTSLVIPKDMSSREVVLTRAQTRLQRKY